MPNDALIAYHEARAKGGAGLIVAQAAGVHETAKYTSHVLMASEESVPRLSPHGRGCAQARLQAVRAAVPSGREIMESQDGSMPVAYAPSAVPNERFHVMPRPMYKAMIDEVINGYGESARRLRGAGLTGWRSSPATATCRRSSSTRASTCAPTNTAAASRTGCGSCARSSRRCARMSDDSARRRPAHQRRRDGFRRAAGGARASRRSWRSDR